MTDVITEQIDLVQGITEIFPTVQAVSDARLDEMISRLEKAIERMGHRMSPHKLGLKRSYLSALTELRRFRLMSKNALK